MFTIVIKCDVSVNYLALMFYHIGQVTLDREEQWNKVKEVRVQQGKSRVKEQKRDKSRGEKAKGKHRGSTHGSTTLTMVSVYPFFPFFFA